VAKVAAPQSLQVVRKIMKGLGGEEILLERKLAERLRRPASPPDSFRKSDAVVAVGGDGTVLLAQSLASGVPVLGVHLAGRGFLADVELRDLGRAIKALKSGQLPVVERDRLAPVLKKRKLPQALNDIVVCHCDAGRTVDISVKAGAHVAMKMRGDGVIVATPTGSTAYARAAGGPVLDPCLEAVLIVPVCPTQPWLPPLVASMNSKIEVEVTSPDRAALVNVDGNQVASLSAGDRLLISRSEVPARFFAWGEFFTKLRERL
jgi:NAD+ kinase